MVRGLRRRYSRVWSSSCACKVLWMATRVREHTSVAQLASTSSSVLSSLANSLRDYELDKHDQEELHGENYLRFPVFGQYVLLLRRGLAKSQGHVYLEKQTNLPGFRVHDPRVYTWRIGLQKRWTNETVSVAAIFSRRCSRVGKNPGLRRWPDKIISADPWSSTTSNGYERIHTFFFQSQLVSVFVFATESPCFMDQS